MRLRETVVSLFFAYKVNHKNKSVDNEQNLAYPINYEL